MISRLPDSQTPGPQTPMIRPTLLLIAMLAGCAPAPSNDSPAPATVVYLVRHAEAEHPMGSERAPDPVLSEAGRQRAEALAELLKGEGVTHVMSSDFNRTRETAAPLAEALNVDVELYDPHDLEVLALSLKQAAGRIVVVGHSNTTPALVELLGGDPGPPIDEQVEFDRLYKVTLESDGRVTTDRSKYGG